VVTILISLILYRTVPLAIQGVGMAVAILATVLMALEEEAEAPAKV
jgi:hypothetical protein